MTKLMVSLENTEAEALAQLAYAELRDPREQLRLILRQELARRGLLNTPASTLEQVGEEQGTKQ